MVRGEAGARFAGAPSSWYTPVMRLYLDTSVISALYAHEAPHLRAATETFFAQLNVRMATLYGSDLVAAEIERTPQPAKRAALHIATAVVHNIPVLVSWNFAHIVKHRTRVEVNRINQAMGHPPIDLCTPEEV